MSETIRIGLVGDGQLGRMIIEAAPALEQQYDLDLQFTALGTAGPDSPAAQVGARQLHGDITDPSAIRKLAEAVDIITPEIEHGNNEALLRVHNAGLAVVRPDPTTLIIIADKLRQKDYFVQCGIAVAPYRTLNGEAELATARKVLGDDVIVKARRGSYDGRGNLAVDPSMSWEDIVRKFGNLADAGGLYVEGVVPFRRELSQVGATDLQGNVALYPVVETVHNKNHTCDTVFAPANIDPRVRNAAEAVGRQTIAALTGAGVMAVELFETYTDEVMVNEAAPRVHNSGHVTDLGSETSQFEQHLRAILGLPLGSTAMRAPAAVMVNILGTQQGTFEEYMRGTTVGKYGHVRWYGKSPRPATERKIGHITALGNTPREALSHARSLQERYVA